MTDIDIVKDLERFVRPLPSAQPIDFAIMKALREIEELRALLMEAHDELAKTAHLEYRYRADYPDEMRRYKRDMDLPDRIAAAIRDSHD